MLDDNNKEFIFTVAVVVVVVLILSALGYLWKVCGGGLYVWCF